jgi:site-specific DNA-methyltransferase (adenine-specific)
MLELNKVYCMDCFDGLKLIDDNSVDLIITDPPYNINYFSNSGSEDYKLKIQTAQDWDNNFDISKYIPEFLRILKNDCYLLIFGCEENISKMKELGCFQVLVWDKCYCGMGDLSDFGIGYEFIFYFKKGNPKLRGDRVNGVISIKHIGFFDKTVHPTQKPIKLIRYLIEKTSDKNALVFDGFLGSGTTAIACKQTLRDFIGFDINQSYVDIAKSRLSQTNLKEFVFEK